MNDMLQFACRADFRHWLTINGPSSDGVWLRFGKQGGPATLPAQEALEEALCFGWIDGQMKRLDALTYAKYFARRRPGSPWSEKNKALAEMLERQGLMTDAGRQKIEEAKRDRTWDAPKPPAVTQEQIAALSSLLTGHEPARTHFEAMPPSVKRTYARAYLDAKTDAGRERRLNWMVERLNQNLRPM